MEGAGGVQAAKAFVETFTQLTGLEETRAQGLAGRVKAAVAGKVLTARAEKQLATLQATEIILPEKGITLESLFEYGKALGKFPDLTKDPAGEKKLWSEFKGALKVVADAQAAVKEPVSYIGSALRSAALMSGMAAASPAKKGAADEAWGKVIASAQEQLQNLSEGSLSAISQLSSASKQLGQFKVSDLGGALKAKIDTALEQTGEDLKGAIVDTEEALTNLKGPFAAAQTHVEELTNQESVAGKTLDQLAEGWDNLSHTLRGALDGLSKEIKENAEDKIAAIRTKLDEGENPSGAIRDLQGYVGALTFPQEAMSDFRARFEDLFTRGKGARGKLEAAREQLPGARKDVERLQADMKAKRKEVRELQVALRYMTLSDR